MIATSHAQPCKPALFARVRAWLGARPTRRQRQTTVDLRFASDKLQRDIGVDRLTFTERRW
ncbi:hypothetical protein [Devosia sp.]|uniref:hypothetical protein n=1 Tax=Devosia sp. TaxID=1871048 RepID=UPI00262D878F|nr:hypothetical protein [Devosia sp.]